MPGQPIIVDRQSACMYARTIPLYGCMDRHSRYKDLKIKYCPTDSIIGEYLTNPLQGAKYSE